MQPDPIDKGGDLAHRVVAMERDVGSGDWDAARRWFTADVAYHVAGRPPFRGVEGIRKYMEWQRRIVTWLGHRSHLVFELQDTVVIEADSHFERIATRTRFDLPCTDVYRFRPDGGRKLIYDWRVYADVSHFLNQAFPFEETAPRG
ncbi:MAG: nuclear transport factor 2 family protein [Pseudomonadota bacterium]